MLDENKDIKVEELEAYSIWLIYNLQNLFNIVGTVVVMRILIVLAVILLSWIGKIKPVTILKANANARHMAGF